MLCSIKVEFEMIGGSGGAGVPRRSGRSMSERFKTVGASMGGRVGEILTEIGSGLRRQKSQATRHQNMEAEKQRKRV